MSPTPAERLQNTHYVVRIVVEKVEKHEGTGRGDDKKFRTTIANVVVGAPTVGAVIDKAQRHLGLIEDGGDIT